jgi:hypothetical protein
MNGAERGLTMEGLVTRRIVVRGQAVELWESPDTPFDATRPALAHYAASGAWVTLFNALALTAVSLQAE